MIQDIATMDFISHAQFPNKYSYENNNTSLLRVPLNEQEHFSSDFSYMLPTVSMVLQSD